MSLIASAHGLHRNREAERLIQVNTENLYSRRIFLLKAAIRHGGKSGAVRERGRQGPSLPRQAGVTPYGRPFSLRRRLEAGRLRRQHRRPCADRGRAPGRATDHRLSAQRRGWSQDQAWRRLQRRPVGTADASVIVRLPSTTRNHPASMAPLKAATVNLPLHLHVRWLTPGKLSSGEMNFAFLLCSHLDVTIGTQGKHSLVTKEEVQESTCGARRGGPLGCL
jgi:hypothetical protein